MVSQSSDESQYPSDIQEIYSQYRERSFIGLDRPSTRELIAHGVYHSHIPHDNVLNRGLLRIGANQVKVKIPQNKRSGGGARGEIIGFSAASRKRLIELINLWRNTEDMVFVTLTYHNEWSDDWRDWKRQLDTFIKRLKYHYPNARGIWRLEFQKRGAPHFHLLVAGMPDLIQGIIKDVTEWWGELAHKTSEYKGIYATKVERIVNRKQAGYYVTKYVAKLEDNQQDEKPSGRVWGKFGEIDLSERVIPMLIENLRQIRNYVELVLETKEHPYALRLKNAQQGVGWSVFGIGDCGESGTIAWEDIMKALFGL